MIALNLMITTAYILLNLKIFLKLYFYNSLKLFYCIFNVILLVFYFVLQKLSKTTSFVNL